jgi:hypothetical protein
VRVVVDVLEILVQPCRLILHVLHHEEHALHEQDYQVDLAEGASNHTLEPFPPIVVQLWPIPKEVVSPGQEVEHAVAGHFK